MSELKNELDEMEQNNYSINSTTMDPKNNEELIIYVSLQLFCNLFVFSLIFLPEQRCKIFFKMFKTSSNACLSK